MADLDAARGVARSQADESGRVAQLALYGNQLSGPIPAELGQLTNLERLSLSDNQLSGPIPAELGQLTSLEFCGFSTTS